MEKYQFLAKVAEGAYGTVWKCQDKETGAIVAVKKLKEPPQNKADAEFAMREVRLLQQISHINVVRLIEAYQSASGRLYLVFEYVHTTVLQLLKAPPQQGMPVKQVQSIMWQTAQALIYLHSSKIIHRDIKPSNILMSDDGVVKLCDFGFARPFAMGSETAAQYTTYVVTRWYRPPEVLVGDTYGPAVDLWALGCIFVELLTGRPLFPGKTQHDQLWLVLRAIGSLTDRQMKVMRLDDSYKCFRPPAKSECVPLDSQLAGFSGPMLQVVHACLQPDADRRVTAAQLVQMSFFEGVADVLPPLCRHQVPQQQQQQQQGLAQDVASQLADLHMQHLPPDVKPRVGNSASDGTGHPATEPFKPEGADIHHAPIAGVSPQQAFHTYHETPTQAAASTGPTTDTSHSAIESQHMKSGEVPDSEPLRWPRQASQTGQQQDSHPPHVLMKQPASMNTSLKKAVATQGGMVGHGVAISHAGHAHPFKSYDGKQQQPQPSDAAAAAARGPPRASLSDRALDQAGQRSARRMSGSNVCIDDDDAHDRPTVDPETVANTHINRHIMSQRSMGVSHAAANAHVTPSSSSAHQGAAVHASSLSGVPGAQCHRNPRVALLEMDSADDGGSESSAGRKQQGSMYDDGGDSDAARSGKFSMSKSGAHASVSFASHETTPQLQQKGSGTYQDAGPGQQAALPPRQGLKPTVRVGPYRRSSTYTGQVQQQHQMDAGLSLSPTRQPQYHSQHAQLRMSVDGYSSQGSTQQALQSPKSRHEAQAAGLTGMALTSPSRATRSSAQVMETFAVGVPDLNLVRRDKRHLSCSQVPAAGSKEDYYMTALPQAMSHGHSMTGIDEDQAVKHTAGHAAGLYAPGAAAATATGNAGWQQYQDDMVTWHEAAGAPHKQQFHGSDDSPGEGVAYTAAQALDKASQRLNKAAKMIGKTGIQSSVGSTSGKKMHSMSASGTSANMVAVVPGRLTGSGNQSHAVHGLPTRTGSFTSGTIPRGYSSSASQVTQAQQLGHDPHSQPGNNAGRPRPAGEAAGLEWQRPVYDTSSQAFILPSLSIGSGRFSTSHLTTTPDRVVPAGGLVPDKAGLAGAHMLQSVNTTSISNEGTCLPSLTSRRSGNGKISRT